MLNIDVCLIKNDFKPHRTIGAALNIDFNPMTEVFKLERFIQAALDIVNYNSGNFR
jgi:hypothetical protein